MSRAARVGAAVDVGSNSVHLLIATVGPVRLRPLADESVQLGLGPIVDREGSLPAEAREATLSALRGYVDRARALRAEHVTLVATEPLRRAANRSAFQAEVLRATGLPLHVLTHESEAELTLLGVLQGRPLMSPLLVLDIGGGSSELILVAPGADPVVGAMPIGSARLAAGFLAHDPPTPDEVGAMRAAAAGLLADLPGGHPQRGVVTGGTGINTNRLLDRLRSSRLNGAVLERALATLAGHPAAELALAHGLSERRVRQLAAGVALVEAALARYRLRSFAVSDASIREGAIVVADRVGDAWPERLPELIVG